MLTAGFVVEVKIEDLIQSHTWVQILGLLFSRSSCVIQKKIFNH